MFLSKPNYIDIVSPIASESVWNRFVNMHLNNFKNYIPISDDKDQKKSQKILAELENIDDECDQNDIAFVKIDDDKEAQEWGIDEIPTIVSVPNPIQSNHCIWLQIIW